MKPSQRDRVLLLDIREAAHELRKAFRPESTPEGANWRLYRTSVMLREVLAKIDKLRDPPGL